MTCMSLFAANAAFKSKPTFLMYLAICNAYFTSYARGVFMQMRSNTIGNIGANLWMYIHGHAYKTIILTI